MQIIHFSKFKSLVLCGIIAASLSACGLAGTPFRDQVAARIASPAWMIERQIPVEPFNLTVFERMHERGRVATLYFSGDGFVVDEDTGRALLDSTPVNPVALHLASKDKAINLAYLARPCQYSGQYEAPYSAMEPRRAECDTSKWKGVVTRTEVMAAYNTALDKMKRRYGLSGFHLVGYDSGATLAALLASTRHDVLSLRSVAGEFDLEQLGPYRMALRGIPQHHFSGGQDEHNTPAEIHGYLQFLGPNECTDHSFIQEAAHATGWVDKWPELLRERLPVCVVAPTPEFVPVEVPEPIFYPRMSGDKK